VPRVKHTCISSEIDGHAFHSLLKPVSIYADVPVLGMQLIYKHNKQDGISHVWKCFVRICSMITAVPSANCLANKSKFFSEGLDQTSIDFPQG